MMRWRDLANDQRLDVKYTLAKCALLAMGIIVAYVFFCLKFILGK